MVGQNSRQGVLSTGTKFFFSPLNESSCHPTSPTNPRRIVSGRVSTCVGRFPGWSFATWLHHVQWRCDFFCKNSIDLGLGQCVTWHAWQWLGWFFEPCFTQATNGTRWKCPIGAAADFACEEFPPIRSVWYIASGYSFSMVSSTSLTSVW